MYRDEMHIDIMASRYTLYDMYDNIFNYLKTGLSFCLKTNTTFDPFINEILDLTETGLLKNESSILLEVFDSENFLMVEGSKLKVNDDLLYNENLLDRYFLLYQLLYSKSTKYKGLYLKLLTNLMLSGASFFNKEIYDYFVNDYYNNYRSTDNQTSINFANTVLNWNEVIK